MTYFHSKIGVLSGEGIADKFLLNEWNQSNFSMPGIEAADGRLPHLRLGEGVERKENISV